MAFFKKLFEKKVCDLCGGEIGLLGNRKLEDGNCCKACAGKLSHWFDDRRHSTVEDIRSQLAYRAENLETLRNFRPGRILGEYYRVYFDEAGRRFFVTNYEDYMSENPDILSFDQVLSCEFRIDDDKTELMREITDKEGNTKEVSYSPKRFRYSYDFEIILQVQHPYFDDMRFRLNRDTLELEATEGIRPGAPRFTLGTFDPTRSIDYRNYVAMGEEIVRLLTAQPEAAPVPEAQAPVEEAPAATPKFCPNCGAPFEGGKFCGHCGSRL